MFLNNYTGHVLFPLTVTEDRTTGPLTFTEKLHIIRVSVFVTLRQTLVFKYCSGYTIIPVDSWEQGLLRFVFPLGLVYFAEYFINQGLVSYLVPSGITFISLHVVKPTSFWCWLYGGMSCNVTH